LKQNAVLPGRSELRAKTKIPFAVDDTVAKGIFISKIMPHNHYGVVKNGKIAGSLENFMIT